MLFVLAVFLIVYSLEEFYSFKTIQTIQISSTQLFDFQIIRSHSCTLLCASNLISILLVIFLVNIITKNKHDNTLIFLGMLAGILSNLPFAGLILFGFLIIYYLISLPFVLGWQDATKVLGYSLFFYIGTLTIISLNDFGLTISITFGITFGLIAYFLTQKLIELVLITYNYIKWLLGFAIYKLKSES